MGQREVVRVFVLTCEHTIDVHVANVAGNRRKAILAVFADDKNS